jgi:hypothetical protein
LAATGRLYSSLGVLGTGWKSQVARPYRSRVVTYGTAKLCDVDDTYYYAVGCRSCSRNVRLSLVRLRLTLGDGYAVADVVKHLRCRTCRGREVTVTFLAPHQAVGNLWHLFQQPAV